MRKGMVAAVAALAAACAAPVMAEDVERSVLAELNRARMHPQEVADALRRYRALFEGRVVREDGDPVGVTTVEGRRAVDEAIAFLDRQEPLPPLAHGPVLARAAQGWAAEQGADGGVGHRSARGGSPGARVRAAGGDVYVGETISYGMARAAAVVRQLIVDDGVAGRGHRALVFSPGFRFAGVGCGAHARYGSMCVIDYAETADGAPVLPQVAAVERPARVAFGR